MSGELFLVEYRMVFQLLKSLVAVKKTAWGCEGGMCVCAKIDAAMSDKTLDECSYLECSSAFDKGKGSTGSEACGPSISTSRTHHTSAIAGPPLTSL
uniref:Uncharacterized protein n=1 Tax=Glossina palpalis gambiensis TaxID=67801 RepID=A0A1B0C4A1_9MUSC